VTIIDDSLLGYAKCTHTTVKYSEKAQKISCSNLKSIYLAILVTYVNPLNRKC